MNKIFKLLLVFIFITSCSLNKYSKFWNKEKLIIEVDSNKQKILKKEEVISLEFNQNLKINISTKLVNNNFSHNHNNNGRINYNGKFENKSKYKFTKIKKFHQYEPEIIFNGDNIIFFDNRGTILNFDKELLFKS